MPATGSAPRQGQRSRCTRVPSDELSWVSRALSRLPGDPSGGPGGHREGPGPESSLVSRRSRTRPPSSPNTSAAPEEAVAALESAIGLYPDAVKARGRPRGAPGPARPAGRGSEDARVALRLDSGAATLYQVAGIYALTAGTHPEDAREALRLLAAAIGRDPTWLKAVPSDPDLEPIRARPEFRKLVDALGILE